MFVGSIWHIHGTPTENSATVNTRGYEQMSGSPCPGGTGLMGKVDAKEKPPEGTFCALKEDSGQQRMGRAVTTQGKEGRFPLGSDL